MRALMELVDAGLARALDFPEEKLKARLERLDRHAAVLGIETIRTAVRRTMNPRRLAARALNGTQPEGTAKSEFVNAKVLISVLHRDLHAVDWEPGETEGLIASMRKYLAEAGLQVAAPWHGVEPSGRLGRPQFTRTKFLWEVVYEFEAYVHCRSLRKRLNAWTQAGAVREETRREVTRWFEALEKSRRPRWVERRAMELLSQPWVTPSMRTAFIKNIAAMELKEEKMLEMALSFVNQVNSLDEMIENRTARASGLRFQHRCRMAARLEVLRAGAKARPEGMNEGPQERAVGLTAALGSGRPSET